MRQAWSDLAGVLPAFLASFVEFVEALTIVLALGATRGWAAALAGAAGGLATLGLLVAAFGPALVVADLAWLQGVVGVLVLLFGLRWLRRAILRAAGVLRLHDEAAAYEAVRAARPGPGAPGIAWPSPARSRPCCWKAARWCSSCSLWAPAPAAWCRPPRARCWPWPSWRRWAQHCTGR